MSVKEIQEAVKIAGKIEMGKVIIKQVKAMIKKKAPKSVSKLLKHKATDGVLGFIIGYSVDKLLESGLITDPKRVKQLTLVSECFTLSSAVMTSDALGLSEKALDLLENLNLDKIIPKVK